MGAKCFQVRPERIDLTNVSETLKRSAIAFLDSVAALIANTVSSVTVARGCEAPKKRGGLLLGLKPVRFRPLAIMSCVFSNMVPATKWFGLQHAGVSQECIITKPSTILPLTREKATLWARILRRASCDQIKPYPLLFLFANHSQHSSVERLSTLAQNLFSKVSRFPTMGVLWESKAPLSTRIKGGY